MNTHLKNWFGGVDLSAYQTSNFDMSVTELTTPEYLNFKLVNNNSAYLEHNFEIGEKIQKHQVLLQTDPLSNGLHAPAAGTIVKLPNDETDYLVIKTEVDTHFTNDTTTDHQNLSSTEIIEKLHQCGLAGLGGAGFPTAQKLSHPVETLIINGAECEPYVHCDQALILSNSKEILLGAKILAKACAANNIIIAVENNKTSALAALKNALEDTHFDQITIRAIPALYPSGAEPQLIKFLTGNEVPHDKHPYAIGVGCYNAATAYASYQAVVLHQPLTSRILSLSGSRLKHPGNYRCLIGTPISTLLQAAGYESNTKDKIIIGGPMMGKVSDDIDAGIEKTNYSIIVSNEHELKARQEIRACIRCGECAQVCPEQLLPQQLYSHTQNSDYTQAQKLGLFDCIECGACAYVCPSNIPLVKHYRQAKTDIRAQKLSQQKAKQAQQRFEARQSRLEQKKSRLLEQRETLRAKLKQDTQARKSLLSSALSQASENKSSKNRPSKNRP